MASMCANASVTSKKGFSAWPCGPSNLKFWDNLVLGDIGVKQAQIKK